MVPPLFRDGFYHSGNQFYVEIVDGGRHHRHPRADSGTLHRLLTYTPPTGPVLTKAGKVAKRQPPPHKDEPGHFYSAQLLHYGLKPLKTKEAAKKHLLAAFEGREPHALPVPDKLVKLENELKAEYDKLDLADRQRREKERQEMAEHQRNRQLTRTVGLVDFSEGDTDDSADEGLAWGEISSKDVKQAIKDMPEAQLRKFVIEQAKDIPELDAAVRQHIIAASSKAKRKAVAVEDGRGKELEYGDHVGRFDVASSDLSREYSVRDALVLRLCATSKTRRLWGWFDFDVISGVLRSTSQLPAKPKAGMKLSFQWHGRESGEGQSCFTDHYRGYIIFLGGGKIKGELTWLGKFKFTGTLDVTRSTNIAWPKYIPQWKAEYRSLNFANHDRESTTRWGKWAPEAKPDGPEDSDTTAAGNAESDEDCEYDNCAY